MASRVTLAVVGLAATWIVGLGACVIGYRGKAAISGEHDLVGIEEVRIELPDTPVDLVACTPVEDDPDICPETLSYRAVWSSVAGTSKDAEDNAAKPTIQVAREDGFALITAVVPISVAGLVDLEMETIELPGDRDLQIVGGVGDVAIDGPAATVTVSIDVGDVDVIGGDEGLAVNTEQGSIEVLTAGHADLRTGRGTVVVEQTVGSRDLLVHTGDGNIDVTLAGDADVDLVVRSTGSIRVDTPQITTITERSFERQVGTGTVTIELVTRRGSVEVRSP